MGLSVLREGLQRCPAHQDRRPSLSVRRGHDGRWLVHCFSGCQTEDILQAWGFGWDALFPDAWSRPRSGKQSIPESPLAEARRRILQKGRRDLQRLAPFLPLYQFGDWYRCVMRTVVDVRLSAMRLGHDAPIWEPLSNASRLEVEAWHLEAELDGILAAGRITQ